MLIQEGLPLSCLEIVDCRLLTELGVSHYESGAMLLVRIDGYKETVMKVAAQIKSLLEPILGASAAVPETIPGIVWSKLSPVNFSSKKYFLEMTLPITSVQLLFANSFMTNTNALWQSRPGRGPFKIIFLDTNRTAKNVD